FLIVYGSLYPWDFRPAPASPLDILLASTQISLDRYALRDVAVNLILYMPLGAVADRVFRRSRLRYFWPVLIGFVLSLSVELTQIYPPPRHASLMDLVCNTAGAALGVILAGFLDLATEEPGTTRAEPRPRPDAMTLLVMWVASLTFPLFPVFGR